MAMKGRAKRRPVRPAPIARAVDEGRESLDLYLDEISRVPLLSREEEMELEPSHVLAWPASEEEEPEAAADPEDTLWGRSRDFDWGD